ncbi:hypothetical protein B566_EDAN010015, partial [Ephemera danica]
MNQHELEQHNKPYEIIDCKNCGQSFKNAKDLKFHSCGVPPKEEDDPEPIGEQPLENQQQPIETEQPLQINEDPLQINEEGFKLEQLVQFQQPPELITPDSKKDHEMMISLQGLLDWNPTKIETPPEMVIYIQAEGQTEPTAVKIKYDSMLPEITFNASEEGACPSDESQFSLLSVPNNSEIEQPITDNSEIEQPTINCNAAEQPITDHSVEKQPIIEHIKIEQPIMDHNVQQHIRRDHNMERNHACPECPKEFFKRADLNEKPYMCGTCGKSFAHLSHILRHERIHNGVRPYTCDICMQSFTQSSTLIIH